MIVGVCGLGYSGSGAVITLLKEYDETKVFDDFEFVLTYIPDGIEDLEYHLMNHCCRYYDSDMAINRFKKYIKYANSKNSGLRRCTNNKVKTITNEYLNSITQLKWSGFWSVDITHFGFLGQFKMRIMTRVYKFLFAITKKHMNISPNRNMYMSIKPTNFYDASKQYIKNILNEMGCDNSKITILDQPFSGDNPQNSFKFFDDPYAIVVDRDPRDLYLVAKKIGVVVGRFMPTDNVETFVEYYKSIRKTTAISEDASKVLRIQFEDLIYEYDKTVKTIETFLGLKNHINIKKFFNPDVSINNTQLFIKFHDLEMDVQYIEENLKEYLYLFEKYPPIKHIGKSF